MEQICEETIIMKHKHEDYKLSAVKYYLEEDTSIEQTCLIFKCSKGSLHRWIQQYKQDKQIERRNRKPMSYKVTNEHVRYALDELKKNEQITMEELRKKVINKYSDFSITSQHLGKVIRDANKTRKRTKKSHFPETRWRVPIDLQTELNSFFRVVDQYSLDKIICLDETSIQAGMIPEYSRCELGKRCVVKTNDNRVFKKFTLLVAISSKGVVGHTLYEKGGMTGERMVDFLRTHITSKYSNHLIIMDNAKAHKTDDVKKEAEKHENKLLFSIPYQPKTNAIETWFSQLKQLLKLDRSIEFYAIKQSIRRSIEQMSKQPQKYMRHFQYAYRKQELRVSTKEKSTLYRKPKLYKQST